MKPTLSSLRVDKILTQASQMYRNASYVNELIMPRLTVQESSGKFAKYGKENLRAFAGQAYRAPGVQAHSVDYSVSQGSYICSEKALEKIVPDEFQRNADLPYNPKRDTAEILTDNIMINQELALATAMQNTSIITQYTTLTSTDQWTDTTNSDPIAHIQTGINTVRTATAQRPNVLLFGYASWDKFKVHPLVREQLKYTGVLGNASDEDCMTWAKSFFRVEEVMIGEAVHNSAEEGQTDSLSDIWGDNVWVLYRTKTPTLMKATFGLTLTDVPRQVDVRRDEDRLGDIVRVRDSYDQCIMDAALCYLIKDTNA